MPDHADADTKVAGRALLHRLVYEEILKEIRAGKYRLGDRLPSEAALCERFNTSRITIAKALQNLQREGVIVRRAGSGSFVEAAKDSGSLQFGLLIPDLGRTEIFEPICKGLMNYPGEGSHSLVWGQGVSTDGRRIEDAERLCQQFIRQKVAGVFFAPIEYVEGGEEVNLRLMSLLKSENIHIVQLDRSFENYTTASGIDLVGIDNHRAGFALTSYLGQQGAKRIIYAARSRSASTITGRIRGYEEAIRGLNYQYKGHIFFGDVEDKHRIEDLLAQERPDAIVCGNDMTAAKLMQTLISLGVRIPEDIRMVGVDDVAYARYLPVPLTTIHQNCEEIGHMAMMLMLDRIRNPKRAAVEIHVGWEFIVRDSCGSKLNVR
jgi:GntR family transcriptional regulator, arabinose operon transcriptional repressor